MTTLRESDPLRERIERLEAVEAIRKLKARYLNACDSQDPDAARDCFARGEVTIDMGHVGVFHSAGEFAEFYRAAGCHDYVLDTHHGANPEIEILDDAHAAGRWGLDYRNINTRDRTVTLLSALYHDEYVRIDGDWKIASSRVEFKSALHCSYASGALEALLAGRSVAGGGQHD